MPSRVTPVDTRTHPLIKPVETTVGTVCAPNMSIKTLVIGKKNAEG
jgi:hypothetical protein